MNRRTRFPQEALTQSIELAKRLVVGHTDPQVSAGARLREIGAKLKVSRIEPGAVRTAGFLKRLPDRTFVIYYANDCSLARRRFTVAHELAHLVLERFHRHIGRKEHRCDQGLEGAVDRIAAEILMPGPLVLETLRTECERRQSPTGKIQKRIVIQELGKTLGVSERALVFRLLELHDLLSVRLRVQWDENRGPKHARYSRLHSFHTALQFNEWPFPDPRNLESEDGWEHGVTVETQTGKRVIWCNAWRRPADRPEEGNIETWIFGWAWNANPPPPWDDAQHTAG